MLTLYDYLDDSPPQPVLEAAKVEPKLFDAGSFGDGSAKVIRPRPYQTLAVQSLQRAWQESSSSLLVMATGLGKTATASLCIRESWERGQGTLFIAHREEIVDQTAATLRAMLPGVSVGKEQAESRSSANDMIVVGSKDTLWREPRLREMGRNRFANLFIDEAHHYVKKNKTYQNIVDYFDARIAGLTATPDRSDEISLGHSFASVAFVYETLDGIRDGYLVRPYQRFVYPVQFDLDSIDCGNGDFSDEEAEKAISRERTLESIVQACIQYSCEGGVRQTLVFCPSVATAKTIAERLNLRNAQDKTGAASVVSSDLPKDLRKISLQLFREKQIRYLVNYGVLTEGVDLPATSLIVNARITKSRHLYAQIVGRGLRPLSEIAGRLTSAPTVQERLEIIKNSGKSDCWVIDLAGVSSKHKLVSLVDILGGKHADEVIEAARKKIAEKAEKDPIDVTKEVEAQAVKAEADFFAMRPRLGQLVKLGEVEVDCFDVLGVPPSRRYGWDHSRPMSDRQREVLEAAGFSKQDLKGMDFRKASSSIDAIIKRREKGMCTYRQAKKLIANGYSPDLSFEAASRIMDGLAKRGWYPRKRKKEG